MHRLLTTALLSVLPGLVMPDKWCVVYVNPLGIAAPTLQKLKEDVMTAEELEYMPENVRFEETDVFHTQHTISRKRSGASS